VDRENQAKAISLALGSNGAIKRHHTPESAITEPLADPFSDVEAVSSSGKPEDIRFHLGLLPFFQRVIAYLVQNLRLLI
jgi:hypothetical protein